MQLDHIVINTRYSLDEAQIAFSTLGFSLTERGFHSLGSINHLMMFGTDYLELIGLPATPADANGPTTTRAGVSDAPFGINGLVFKTDDADATYAHLQSIGMAGDPPTSFSRPVSLDNGKTRAEARFRTVHVRPDCVPAGRVYFCEHKTPELVWRPEWQKHDNRAQSMSSILLVSDQPAIESDRFAQLLGVEADPLKDGMIRLPVDGFDLLVASPDEYNALYGGLASDGAGRDSFFGALTVRTDNLLTARSAVEVAQRYADMTENILVSPMSQNTFSVRQVQFDTVMAFTNFS